MSIKTAVVNKLTAIIGKVFTGTLSQEERARIAGKPDTAPEMQKLARNAASEGIVLLENRGVLPFSVGDTLSVFGRVQLDYFAVGYGSGGDVNRPYVINLIDGLVNSDSVKINTELAEIYRKWVEKHPADHGFWGHWPRFHPEMPLPDDIISSAAEKSSAAVIVIGRSSGEDRENALQKGSYYLTDAELSMLDRVINSFDKTAVLLNCGSIIDMSWTDRYSDRQLAVLYVWQGGMESGNGIADVLTGKVNPSGRLSDTIAKQYEDYPSADCFGNSEFNNYSEDVFVGYRYFETFKPERVQYPFGFGLSYTSFDISCSEFIADTKKISLSVTVKNTGSVAGSEVVQIYYSAPCGLLGKPSRSLCAFAKTDIIQPASEAQLNISFDTESMASYDDTGITGHKSCYLLESGNYRIYVGKNVRGSSLVGSYTVNELTVTKQLSAVCPIAKGSEFERLTAAEENGDTVMRRKMLDAGTDSLKTTILSRLPQAIERTSDKGIKLSDVSSGKASLNDFIAQLSDEELEALCRGDYMMNSPLGAPGNAAVCGGVLQSLRDKGIRPVTATDGPSGIRIAYYASLLPIGTMLACTWNTKSVSALYEQVGKEMIRKGSDILLAPGMNIHRNPLCGRNFEYFSEDPVISGNIAAAVVTGIQSSGVSACPKHFACNNQEINRCKNDSRVSERALREIYFKGFEICVKTAKPKNIMTSYNKINGVWSHYNYDLATSVLRNEWGYDGCVMTDWWMRPSKDPHFPKLYNNAYRVRAQVDLLMPGSGAGSRRRKYDKSLLASVGSDEGLTLGEIQRSAANTLKMIMRLN